MKQVTIAIVQMYSEFGNISGNVLKAERYVRLAAEGGAQLIILPEMFNTGVNFNDMEADMTYAEPPDGPTLRRFAELAKEKRVHILCPLLVEVERGKWENKAFLIDDEGRVLGGYAKTHPVGDERRLLLRGTSYPVFDTKLCKIGILICYDACFPETARILALQGAELILVPAAWRGSHYFKEWWDINLQCRAIDNLVYVAAANQCGCTGDGTEMYAGKSQVINPIGQVQKMAGIEEEAILYQTIYPERVAKEREFNTVLTDRHIEDYAILSEK